MYTGCYDERVTLVRRELIGLVVSFAILVLLLFPYPVALSPFSLYSLVDPMSGVWINALTAKVPAEEKIVLPGIDHEVIVVFDKYGVPHFFAESEKDLAYAIGYIHARDRLWQMDFLRRVVEGRLTEIFGNISGVYESDLLFRIVGLKRGAYECEKLLKEKFPDLYELLEAYSEGVNRAIEDMKLSKTLPIEFKLLRYEPEPWTPLNSLEIGRIIGWGLTGTFADLYLYLILQKFGINDTLQLMPIDRYKEVYIVKPGYKVTLGNVTKPKAISNMELHLPDFDEKAVEELLEWKRKTDIWFLPIKEAFASNNWVISGFYTNTGKPLLCNDPHLSLTVPPVWYEVHYVVKSGDEIFNVRGVTFPGIPIVIIGSNQYVGWGFTNVMADQIDFYYYVWKNDTHYWYKDAWHKIRQVKEVFRIKTDAGFVEKVIYINFTVHGPLLEMKIDGKRYRFAVRWMGQNATTEAYALWKYAHAHDIYEFLSYTNYFQMPPQNHVFADIYGNIGWRACGRYPNRTFPNGTNAVQFNPLIPRLPINGSDPNVIEWNDSDWIEPWEAPQLINPPWGYIVTANNKAANVSDYPYIYDIAWTWADYYRASRIQELINETINEKGYVTIEDMMRIQNDVLLVLARSLKEFLADVAGRYGYENIKNLIENWDCRMTINSTAATIFVVWYDYYKNFTFSDEFREKFESKDLQNLWMELPDNTLEHFTLTNKSWKWFNDVGTKERENATTIAGKALKAAIEYLKKYFGTDDINEWKFGKLHKLNAQHAMGSTLKWLNYPNWEALGWSNCVNNIGRNADHGPSWREILDFSDLNNSRCIIPGGQSGNPFSEHYYDQLRMWLDGEYKKMSFPATPEEVEDAESIIHFVPG